MPFSSCSFVLGIRGREYGATCSRAQRILSSSRPFLLQKAMQKPAQAKAQHSKDLELSESVQQRVTGLTVAAHALEQLKLRHSQPDFLPLSFQLIRTGEFDRWV